MTIEAIARVQTVIEGHTGRAAAISIAQVGNVTGLSAREIKQAVHDLRMQGIRIGSARVAEGDAVAGYYMVATREELIDSLRPYQHQVASEIMLIQQLMGRQYRSAGAFLNQLALDLQPEGESDGR